MKTKTPKDARPPDHSSPRRWIKYVARNHQLVGKVKDPRRYLNRRGGRGQ